MTFFEEAKNKKQNPRSIIPVMGGLIFELNSKIDV